MSVEELQAHIDKLSADIDLQKEVLKQLDRSKSATQRQLIGAITPRYFLRDLYPMPSSLFADSRVSICTKAFHERLQYVGRYSPIYSGPPG
ncbi:hypothetical protein MVEN_02366100 [Mycena venus]|uniref:Uncharacterized protein n=1 Tax=Mycena venus TaxID=2733690 RepID=A0A8H6X3S4_9AGAR|nr:hypothetical protein MVEN_02366100 [Mycena venus]